MKIDLFLLTFVIACMLLSISLGPCLGLGISALALWLGNKIEK